MAGDTHNFTPALGHATLTPLYDSAIAVLTREGRWRNALVQQIAPKATDVIVDVGCGTGTLVLMLKRVAPSATIIGLDPDPAVLDLAKAKAQRAGANEVQRLAELGVTKAVSSLVFHQTPMSEKRAGVLAMHDALLPSGELHVADYGLQRTPLMRTLFRQIQRLDGVENTTPNAEGVLPRLMSEAGFVDVTETVVIPTPTGSISLYLARKG